MQIYLFVVIFGIMVMALIKATVAKAAYCADNLKKIRQRNHILFVLKTDV